MGIRNFLQLFLKLANGNSLKPCVLIGISNGVFLSTDLEVQLLDPLLELLFNSFKPQLGGLACSDNLKHSSDSSPILVSLFFSSASRWPRSSRSLSSSEGVSPSCFSKASLAAVMELSSSYEGYIS